MKFDPSRYPVFASCGTEMPHHSTDCHELVLEHLSAHHRRRWRKEIKRDRKKADIKDAMSGQSIRVSKGKKLIGAKMRKVIETERARVRDYRKRTTMNLKRNIQLMKLMQIRPKDTGILIRRFNAIKAASKKR